MIPDNIYYGKSAFLKLACICGVGDSTAKASNDFKLIEYTAVCV